MTLRQLESFLAVVREGSFTRAARRIHLSQPTLSAHILELEDGLGKRLFSRHGRKVSVTEAGRVLEPYAARVLGTLESAAQAVSELDGLRHGSLLVGASTTPGIYVLPRLIGQFRARYPGITLALRIANSRAIEERVRGGHFDLGVVGGHVLGAGEQCLAAGLVDELVLIVPRRHAWARRRTIDVKRFCDEPVLMREEGSATRHLTERALQQAGLQCRAAMELDHTEAIKQAVMAGLGVALVSVHAVRGELAARRLVALRVRGLHLRRHFHVIHDEGRPLSASAQAFVRLLEAQAKSAT
jgi:LysR family transcriptional regulator, low CO2-responsive transcriptional regulator